MNLMRPLLFFTDKDKRWLFFDAKGFMERLPDREYIIKKYLHTIGVKPNLDKPTGFNEKIQWLKLNDRNPIYRNYVDKVTVKEIVANIIGKNYIIPTISTFDSFKNIDYSQLPEKFVMKCNHDSGSVYIHVGGKIDFREIKKLQKGFNRDYYMVGREFPYKDLKHKVLIEEIIGDGKPINDYKLFVFNGKVEYIQVDYDRFTNHHRSFFNVDWKYMGFTTRYPTDGKHNIKRPKELEELIECAEKIAKNLNNPAFVRIDFYIVNSKVYFGEVTFYHGSGFEKFYPEIWDYILGDMIKLPMFSYP